jgi:two-component system sensor histidine kinase UhpB
MLQVEGIAASAPDVRDDQIEELRDTARRGIEDVRRIASRLRPEALEDLGLRSALSALATRFGDRTRVRVVKRLEEVPALRDEEELVIYRVAQEALTNVARHADARRVELSLEPREEEVVLTVSDEGRGLTPDAMSSSHGIHGMRERAMLVGGQITIHGAPGRGTQVRLSIPVGREVP